MAVSRMLYAHLFLSHYQIRTIASAAIRFQYELNCVGWMTCCWQRHGATTVCVWYFIMKSKRLRSHVLRAFKYAALVCLYTWLYPSAEIGECVCCTQSGTNAFVWVWHFTRQFSTVHHWCCTELCHFILSSRLIQTGIQFAATSHRPSS